jgi:L-2-hydroxyglutarate oxidase LhgO
MREPGSAHDSEIGTMTHWTVKRRAILGFLAVVVIMIALSIFAHQRLAVIQTQATDLRRDYVPSLYLADRLHVVSIQTYAGVRQQVLEHDPEKTQQLVSYIQRKSIERMDLLTKHETLLTTPDERALAEATRAALAGYVVVRTEVLRLSADPRTRPQAVIW